MKSVQPQESQKPKNKGGRPSKRDTISLEDVEKLAGLGLINTEIAYLLNISTVTLSKYMKDPQFLTAIKLGKLKADKKVGESLYDRARGYECEETKVFCFEGELIEAKVIKHYPPDPTSMIYWLKNRRPDLWRDKTEIDLGLQDPLLDRYKDINGKDLLKAAREIGKAIAGVELCDKEAEADKSA